MSIASTSVIQIIPRTRRGVELLLLIIAIVVSVGAYVNIGITVQDKVPASTGYYAAGIGLLALIAHFALRYRAPYADPVLLPCAVLLNGLGVAMIHRVDLGMAAAAEAAGREPRSPAAPSARPWSACAWCARTVARPRCGRCSCGPSCSRSVPPCSCSATCRCCCRRSTGPRTT